MDSDKKRTTINTWKHLQDNNYFEKHRLYDMETIRKPPMVTEDLIKDKIIVEIGCGYGRHTAWLSKYAKKIYAIEVSENIINKAKTFIKEKGQIEKVEFILVDEYYDKIPNNIDIVYCYLVFQHLTKDETSNYIHKLYHKLNPGGLFIGQFLRGTGEKIPKQEEPRVRYSLKEIETLFSPKYNIERNILERKNENTYHVFIVGRKI